MSTLLLRATHFENLDLSGIPYSRYNSPEALAIRFSVLSSVLTSLGTLNVEFLSLRPHHDREFQPPPLITRFVLPSLTKLWFKGASEYLEYLVLAWTDTPRLDKLYITIFHQTSFDTPRPIH